MIKSILEMTREEAEALGRIGFTHKAGLHYDVCRALADGKTQQQVAEEFNLSETKSVRLIKTKKCPECHR